MLGPDRQQLHPRLPPADSCNRNVNEPRNREQRTLRMQRATAPARSKTSTIDAAILAINHSFIVDNYDCGSPLGTLTVNGAIAQKYRGAVGTTRRHRLPQELQLRRPAALHRAAELHRAGQVRLGDRPRDDRMSRRQVLRILGSRRAKVPWPIGRCRNEAVRRMPIAARRPDAPADSRKTEERGAPLVGLEIEAGSVAAAEVRVNGAPQRQRDRRSRRCRPSAFHDGEVADPERRRRGAARALLPSTSSRKRVRLGIANQRVVVRTLRLPAIEDPEGARRRRPLPGPGADRRCRSTRRCSTTGSSAASPAVDGAAAADRRDRRRRPPRHDRRLAEAAARRRPRTGRRRPLRLRHDPRPRRTPAAAAPTARRRAAAAAARPLLQRRRRHQPRGRQGPLLPLHPRLPRRPRGHRRQPRRGHRPEPRARAHVARPRRPRAAASRRSRATPAIVAEARDGARERRLRAARRAAPLARLLRRPGGRGAGRADRPLRPRQRHPRPRRADGAGARPADRGRPPAGARRPRRRRRGAPHPSLRPRPGAAERCAPST